MTSKNTPAVGSTIHFRASMSVAIGGNADGRVFHRGQELVLTADIIDASKDRLGNSWLDLDASEQVQRYGKQVWGYGPVPDDVDFYNGGDRASRDIARIRARDAAMAIDDPVQREAAWKAVHAEFGSPATSWSTSS